MMKISVALCTYNGERYLGQQLSSIRAQSRQPDELIICDDVSADRTVTIAREFEASVPFPVRVLVNEANLGSSRNFTRAITECSFSDGIIVLSDQDDVWAHEKLARIEEFFMKHPETDLVFSDAEVVEHDLHLRGYRLWEALKFTSKERHEVETGQAIRVMLRHNVVTGATMAFRAGLRPLVLPVPEGVVHDSWIALLVAATGNVRILSSPLVLYRQHGSNQIGVTKLDFLQRLKRPCERAILEAKSALRQYELATELLRKTFFPTVPTTLLDDLSRKAEHLRARIDVALRAPGWFWVMIREIMRGHYHRYSVSWWSIGHDLIKCGFGKHSKRKKERPSSM